MIARALVLATLSVAVPLAWSIGVGRHRRSLRNRVEAVPSTALVFTSSGCPACRTQRALIDLLDDDEAGRVGFVDVSEAPSEAARFGVMSLPTTVFFDADGMVGHIAHGVVDTKAFRRRLASDDRDEPRQSAGSKR